MLAPAIALILLIAGETVLYSVLLRSFAGAGASILRQTKTGWEQVPAPLGLHVRTFRISGRGTVWALGYTYKPALSRWDGAHWQSYRNADFGIQKHGLDGDFALDGEDLWAPTPEGMLHWNGQQWQCYREAPAGAGASVVAGDGQVWVIDETGTLSHFENGKWKSGKVILAGVNWGELEKEDMHHRSPALSRTADGALWLNWRGLWRLHGETWSRIPTQDGELIGTTSDRLWFRYASGLRSLSEDGNHWTAYPAAPAKVYTVASSGDRLWFASETGPLELNGATWRLVALPKNLESGFCEVVAAPDGTLWVMPLAGASRTVRYVLLAALVLALAILAVVVWTLWRLHRRRLDQHRLVTQAVQHATGDVPVELEQGERRLSRGGPLSGILWILGAIFGYALLYHYWPKAPIWIIPLIGAALHLGITFQQSLVKRKAQPYDPIGPGSPSRYDWGKTWKAAAGGLVILLFIYSRHIPLLKYLPSNTLWIFVAISIGYNALLKFLTNRALRRVDYDGALATVRWFYFYNPSGMEPLRMMGHFLLLAGRYREAEDALRRSLVGSHATHSYATALEYLGDALLEQGRYGEAMRSYEGALHAFAWHRRAYRGMAEMLLRQGIDPQKALEYVEKIRDLSNLSWIQRQQNGNSLDDYWSLQAWALAACGRSSEVQPAIEKALHATAKHPADLAATHHRCGMALQILGNRKAAVQHLQQAATLDPHGRRGTLAQAAIRERDIWDRASA